MTTAASDSEWRALVAVNTCNREPFLRRCLPALARACASDPRISLLVSLDGDDPATRAFCETWQVPLLHSDAREGVGLSKNRVLEAFPDFDYYFFLEDDAEILDASVFAAHVAVAQSAQLHHMSLLHRAAIRKPVSQSTAAGHELVHARYGGADFNFFTAEGLRVVGGWHPLFAQYRRWGHTEHSYRFPRNRLAPEAFNVAVDLTEAFIWYAPPSITQITTIPLDADQISVPERELMNQELKHVPLQTISPYHFNGAPLGPLTRLAAVMNSSRRYPLLSGYERREALADYNLWRFEHGRTRAGRLASLAAAIALAPTSMSVKHAIKTRLIR
jgi:hypothetical protein